MPDDTPNEKCHSHPAFAAISDIALFEQHLSDRPILFDYYDIAKLASFAKDYPVAVHRYGLYDSFGKRDLYLIGTSNRGKYVDVEGCMDIYGRLYPAHITLPQNDPESNVRVLLAKLHMETPTAAFFVHVMGEALDMGLVGALTPLPIGYMMVRTQLELMHVNGHSVPPGQETNVRELENAESKHLGSSSQAYILMNAYPFETVDRTVYWLFAGGELVGCNNLRAMRGMVERASKIHPNVPLLVHRAGSEIDFELVRKVRKIDIYGAMVARREVRERCKKEGGPVEA